MMNEAHSPPGTDRDPGDLSSEMQALESSDPDPVTKDDRVIHRAKRHLRPGESREGGVHGVNVHNGGTGTSTSSSCVNPLFAKNSRKSRNSYNHSRGQPKKGGGGGKGVWGKPGSELDATESSCVDDHDPNYDSDNQGEYKLDVVNPVLTDEQLDKVVQPIILEYMEHGNSDEVEDMLSNLNIGPNKHRVAKLAFTLAMERHNPQRELISRLISDLYSRTFSREDIERGFNDLINSLDDVVLDTPDAHILVGQFMARCVADDCLAPKYVTSYKTRVDNEWIKGAVDKASVLLSMNHGIAHLDNIWGVGGGNRPVKYLTNKMIDLLKEFLSSGDETEAMRCLVDLDVPHFHHELVYQACDMVIEDSTDRVRDVIVRLLKFLTSTNVIVVDQFEKGLRRLFTDIQDISLDVPAAYVLLDRLVVKLTEAGMVSKTLVSELPTRGRKRFVSEGDGGRLKAD